MYQQLQQHGSPSTGKAHSTCKSAQSVLQNRRLAVRDVRANPSVPRLLLHMVQRMQLQPEPYIRLQYVALMRRVCSYCTTLSQKTATDMTHTFFSRKSAHSDTPATLTT